MVSEWGDPLQHPLLRVQFQTPQRGLDSHKTPKSIFLWLKHGMITTPKISPKWFLNLSKNGFEKSQKCSLGISCLNAEISCLNAGISCLSFFCKIYEILQTEVLKISKQLWNFAKQFCKCSKLFWKFAELFCKFSKMFADICKIILNMFKTFVSFLKWIISYPFCVAPEIHLGTSNRSHQKCWGIWAPATIHILSTCATFCPYWS